MAVEFMIMWIMTSSTLMMEVSLQHQPIHTRLQGVTSLIQERFSIQKYMNLYLNLQAQNKIQVLILIC
jgi:hypothetical protein